MANILIVEDDSVEAMNLRNSLQSMGYDVDYTASRGEEAVEKAIELDPDLVLMDVMLKGDMTGIEAARSIKELNIPVIYLTSVADDSIINKALLSEPYGYLIKPFDDHKLKISIEVALYKNQMEKRLKKSQENYYQTIFENTGAATAIGEENYLISLVNMEFCSLTGYLKEEIEQKMKWTEFFSKEDLPLMKEYHRLRQIITSAPRNHEARLITRSGDIKNVFLTVAMIPGTKKSTISVIDMTELQKTKKVLEESREKFKGIFENAAEAIVLLDRDGTILEANDKIKNISGFNKEDLIGKKFFKFIPKGAIEYKTALKAFNNLIAGEKLKNMDWTIINREGKEVHFIVHPSVIRKENKIEGLVIIIEDVTERKNAEIKLKNSLEEKEILLREIHHRVKNNLQIISSLMSLQSMRIEDEKTSEILKECRGRVRSMAMIHENLYQSSDISKINFEEYLKKLLSDIHKSYMVKNNLIKLNINVDNVTMGIETAMPCGLIINELVTNSFRHAFSNHKSGNIMVELKSKDDCYILTVADDGVGIPENMTLENPKKLGLMLVKTLINQLKATMKLDRTNGTMVTVKFKELEYNNRMT